MFVGYKRRATTVAPVETEPKLTLSPVEGTGRARKFTINSVAAESLGLSMGDYVSFGYQEDDENMYLFKVDVESLDENERKYAFRVTKEMTFSNKGAYESICNDYGISQEEGGTINLNETVIDNVTYYQLVLNTTEELVVEESETENWKNGI